MPLLPSIPSLPVAELSGAVLADVLKTMGIPNLEERIGRGVSRPADSPEFWLRNAVRDEGDVRLAINEALVDQLGLRFSSWVELSDLHRTLMTYLALVIEGLWDDAEELAHRMLTEKMLPRPASAQMIHGEILSNQLAVRHAYRRTMLLEALAMACQVSAFQPGAHAWIGEFDRVAWLLMSGLQYPTPYAETAAIVAHHHAEKTAGRKLGTPTFGSLPDYLLSSIEREEVQS